MSERKSFKEKFGYDPADYFENGKYNPLLLMKKVRGVGSRDGWETSTWWHNREEKYMSVKQLDKSLYSEEELNEVRAVCHNSSKICHANFFTCFNVHESEDKISVVQNHFHHGSISDYMRKNEPFREFQSRVAVKGLLLAFKYLEIIGFELVRFGLHSVKVNDRKTLTIDDLNLRRTKKREIPAEYLTLWFISGIVLDDKIKVIKFVLLQLNVLFTINYDIKSYIFVMKFTRMLNIS